MYKPNAEGNYTLKGVSRMLIEYYWCICNVYKHVVWTEVHICRFEGQCEGWVSDCRSPKIVGRNRTTTKNNIKTTQKLRENTHYNTILLSNIAVTSHVAERSVYRKHRHVLVTITSLPNGCLFFVLVLSSLELFVQSYLLIYLYINCLWYKMHWPSTLTIMWKINFVWLVQK